MRFTRRARLAGVALVTAGLVLAGCGGGGDDDAGGNNVITVYGVNPQNPMIPTATNEVGGGDPIQNLYSGLTAYNADGSVVNEVAESIESEDSKTWTVKLKDWKFTDGSPVTSESFVRAWTYGADAENKHLNNYFFTTFEGTNAEGNLPKGEKEMSGLKIIDDKTFTITLKSPESDFPLRLGYSAYFPTPDSAFGEDGKYTKEYGNRPIGNGPYMLSKTGWEHNKQIAMVPNPDYTGSHKPENDGLTFKFYTTPDAAYSDVQAGNLDVLDQVPPSALQGLEEDTSVQSYNEPGSNITTLTIPEKLPHFSGEEGNLRRQAISMAINRPEICEKIFYGARTPAKDYTSPVLDGWTENVEGNEVLNFDDTKAKQLWADANKIDEWDGKFVLATNIDGAGNKDFAEAIANQLKNTLGIDASAKMYPTFDEYREVITKRAIKTSFRTAWQADYPSMLNYLGAIYGTGAGSNDGDYSNKEFDKLAADAAAAEGEERYKLIGDAQAILFKDLPVIPLWYQNSVAVTPKDVKGFEFTWQSKPQYYKLTK